MGLTQEEKQEIVASVLSSVRTNSRTIGNLTPVTSLTDSSQFEINGGKRVSFSLLRTFFTELIKQKVEESERNILEAIGGISDMGEISDEGLSLILGIRRVADESGIREFDVSVQSSPDLATYPDGTRAWVEDIHTFVKKEGGEITPLDTYLSGQEPRADLLFRSGNRLYCWRDGTLVQFLTGIDEDFTDILEGFLTPCLLLSDLDTLGTNGTAASIMDLARKQRATRWKVIEGAGSSGDAVAVGLLDLLSDPMKHIVTEVLTTHLTLDESGGLSASHDDENLYVYYRSLNVSSPYLDNERGTWTAWKLLNGDEVHLDPKTGLIGRTDLPAAVIPFDGALNVSSYQQQSLLEAPAGSKIYYDEEKGKFFLQTGSALETKYYPTWGGNKTEGIPSSEEMGPWPSSLYLTGTELWGVVEGRLTRLVGGVLWEPDDDENIWQLGPLANTINDTGQYDPSKVYRYKYKPSGGVSSITEDCWYFGCRYRCKVDGTMGVAPCYGSPNWDFISGNPTFSADFEEKYLMVNMSRLDSFAATLTLTATIYNQSVLDKISSGNITWKRESYDADGNRRTAADNVWVPNTTDGNKRLHLSKADLDYDGTRISKMIFSATVTLGSHSETIAAQLTQMLAYPATLDTELWQKDLDTSAP